MNNLNLNINKNNNYNNNSTFKNLNDLLKSNNHLEPIKSNLKINEKILENQSINNNKITNT